jgi:predicted TPR repeat methyltransferase
MADFDPRSYWEQRLTETYASDGVGYGGLGEGFNDWMYRVRRHVVRRQLGPLARGRPDLRVLDIGSGTGFYVDRWHELGVRSVVGSDITETAVGHLRARYPGDAFERIDAGAGEHPFGERRFDVVTAFDVLFHIVDDARYEQAISNIYELVEPGGLFIFSDNLVHHDTVNYTHQVNRSLEYVEKVLGATGFEVVERRPMYVLMNGAPDTRNPLARWLWLAIAGTVSLGEPVGWLVGALLYPLELLLVRVLRESQSVEMVICRRPRRPGPTA